MPYTNGLRSEGLFPVKAEIETIAKVKRTENSAGSENCLPPRKNPNFRTEYQVRYRSAVDFLLKTSNHLQESPIDEEKSVEVRVLIGKMNLLCNGRLKQFGDLCGRPNILEQDLEGFWDLVLIQVQELVSVLVNLQLSIDFKIPDVFKATEGSGMNGTSTTSSVSKKAKRPKHLLNIISSSSPSSHPKSPVHIAATSSPVSGPSNGLRAFLRQQRKAAAAKAKLAATAKSSVSTTKPNSSSTPVEIYLPSPHK